MKCFDKLPEYCYAISPITGELVYIERGGSYMQGLGSREKRLLTAKVPDVTPAQMSAMIGGVLNGWDSVSANPDNYDEVGLWRGKGGYSGQELQ